MDQRTIPENILKHNSVQGRTEVMASELGRLAARAQDAEERARLAESQAAELREEVERLRSINTELGNIGHSLRSVIATLRKQVDAQLTEINQLYMELERQQRTVTLLVPEFLEAMADIGEYGFEKYGEGSFQARRLKGDNSRGPLERCKSINVCLHGEDHLDAYVRGDKHDHFGTLEHQLAAAAFNAMMEFYFAGFASRSREQEPGK